MNKILKNILIFSVYLTGIIVSILLQEDIPLFSFCGSVFAFLIVIRIIYQRASKPEGIWGGRFKWKYEKEGKLHEYKRLIKKIEDILRIIASVSIFLGIIHYVILLYA